MKKFVKFEFSIYVLCCWNRPDTYYYRTVNYVYCCTVLLSTLSLVRMETADAAALATSVALDHSQAATVTSSDLQVLASAAERVSSIASGYV